MPNDQKEGLEEGRQPTDIPAAAGGPSDKQMRMGAVGGIAAALVGMALVMAFESIGVPGLIVMAMGPVVLCFGLAALWDPNIVRAAGKYGDHLPKRYKLIAVLVGIVSLVLSGLLAVWLYYAQSA